ncbi:pitrilysin family protein [Oscillatoria sp. CS-180]|uniref:M16 family metallopeptidase n=1 Tax=Oscillatoria sp. CS-180 TaxID=3021720 RepID=UPI00232F79B8|nr:pitrilysin family protein [Oscillatoria sp. CS-180]MDB9526362.1 pitrilysin family protein [Oscillatoria sp. CS-180]
MIHFHRPLPSGKFWRPILSLLVVGVLSCSTLLGWPTAALGREATAETTSIQPYLDRVAEQVSEFTLDNGMKFIVLERHQAPVVSFMLYADVGAVNEADGATGIAHYLEHLAFKGTQQIGTTNYAAEKALLDEMDAIFDQLLAAEAAGQAEVAETLRSQLLDLRQQASQYVEQNKYGQIVEQAGGVGLNATTGADATRYFYSLPSNKLELWMSLESERFLEPVFREFYEEKEVILEERRMRVDNSPIGQLIEVFLEEAFEEHPYRRPIIGYQEDLYVATRDTVQGFFDNYYGPNNLIGIVVGDVAAETVQEMAETYFGRFSARSLPAEVTIEEPPQQSPREFTLELPSQPWYLEGYHRPGINHPDHTIYGMIEGILVRGRTSRLYKELVEDQQIALDIGGFSGFPGDKYPNMLILYGLTAPDVAPDQIGEEIHQQLEQLKTEPVSEQELDRVKTQARAGLLRQLDSNAGMAALLAEYEAKTGSWRNIFTELKDIEAVTVEDIQRVAQETFQANNRTVGKIIPVEGS